MSQSKIPVFNAGEVIIETSKKDTIFQRISWNLKNKLNFQPGNMTFLS